MYSAPRLIATALCMLVGATPAHARVATNPPSLQPSGWSFAGGDALPLTWQAYGGIAHSAASWADVSVGHRYLAFENGGGDGVRNLSLGGAIFANFHF